VSYQLTPATEKKITAIRQVTGPSIPELDQVVSTMVGKTNRRYSEPATLEIEISFK